MKMRSSRVSELPCRNPYSEGHVRIAVVTVCLNDLGGLKSTFESVRLQRHHPIQWIVVDGNSSDGTQDWLASLGWSRLSWSSGTDGGIYQGMNKGLREVDADYVLFLNSGDTLATVDDLASVSDFLQRSASKPALLYGDSFEIDTSGAAYLRRARPAWWVWLGMPTTHQAMYFRTDAIRDGFATRYRLSGDYDVVARLYIAHRGADFSHLAQPLCRFHLGGRSDQNRRASLREMLEIRRRILGMGAVPAIMLHVAHHTQGLIKQHAPSVHRVLRYG